MGHLPRARPSGGGRRQAEAAYLDGLIEMVETELTAGGDGPAPSSLVLTWGAEQVAVSLGWIMRAGRLSFDAAAIADCRLSQVRLSRQHIADEVVEVVCLRVENRAGPAYGRPFEVKLPREDYARLEQRFVARVREAAAAIQHQQAVGFGEEFSRILR